MQASRQSDRQELPACFHKYLVKFSIEKISLRVPFVMNVVVALRIGKEETYGKKKVRLEDGQGDVHEKLQLLATLRYNKLTGQHENMRAVLSVISVTATAKNVMGTCSLNLDQLINNRAYGVVRAPLQHSADLSASVDFSVQTIFVESLGDPHLSTSSTSKLDNSDSKFSTPKDGKPVASAPNSANSKASKNSSSEGSNRLTPKRAVGKFSKSKRVAKQSSDKTGPSISKYSGGNLSASKQLLDMLRTPEQKQSAVIEARYRQKRSTKPIVSSSRTSYDFSSAISGVQKQHEIKQSMEETSEHPPDNEGSAAYWQEKFHAASGRLVISEIERDSLKLELQRLRSSQQGKQQVTTLQKRIDQQERENAGHIMNAEKLQVEVANMAQSLKDSTRQEVYQDTLKYTTAQLANSKISLQMEKELNSELSKCLEEARSQLTELGSRQRYLQQQNRQLKEEVAQLQTSFSSECKLVKNLSEQISLLEVKHSREKADLQNKLEQANQLAKESRDKKETTDQVAQLRSLLEEQVGVSQCERQMRQSQAKLHELQRQDREDQLRRVGSQLEQVRRQLVEKQAEALQQFQCRGKLLVEMNILRDRLETVSKSTEQLAAINAQLGQKGGQLESQVQYLSEENIRYAQDKTSLLQRNVSLEQLLRELEGECAKGKEEAMVLNKQLDSQQHLLVEAQHKLKLILKALGGDVVTLTTKHGSAEEHGITLLLNLIQDRLTESVESYRSELSSMRQSIIVTSAEKEQQISQLREQIDELARKLDENKSRVLPRVVKEGGVSRQEHERQIHALEEEIALRKQHAIAKDKQHNEEINRLRKQLHHPIHPAVVEEPKKKTKPAQQSSHSEVVSQLDRQVTTLTALNKELEAKLDQAKSDNLAMKEQFEQLAAANSKLQYKLLAITALNSEQQKEIVRQRTEMEELAVSHSPTQDFNNSFLLGRRNSTSEETITSEEVISLKQELSASKEKYAQLKRQNHNLQDKHSEQCRQSQQLSAELEYVIGACGIINTKLLQHLEPSASNYPPAWNSNTEKLSDLFAKHLEFNIHRLMKSHRIAEQLRAEAEEKLNALETRNKEQSHQMHHDAQKHQAEIDHIHQEVHALRLRNTELQSENKQLHYQVDQLKGQPEGCQAESFYLADLSKMEPAMEKYEFGVQCTLQAVLPRSLNEAAIQTQSTTEEDNNANDYQLRKTSYLAPKTIAEDERSIEDDLNISAVQTPTAINPPDTIESEFDRLEIRDCDIWERSMAIPLENLNLSNVVRQSQQIRKQLEAELLQLRSILETAEQESAMSKSRLREESSKFKYELERYENSRLMSLQRVKQLQKILSSSRSVFMQICKTEAHAKNIIAHFKQVQGVTGQLAGLLGKEGTKHSQSP